MVEKQEKSSQSATGPLDSGKPPLDNPNPTGLDAFVDQVLTAQRAPLTSENRREMREKIGHIQTHRS